MNAALSFGLGVVSSILAAAVFPFVDDIASTTLIHLFGWLPLKGRVDLSGTWQSVWTVESQRFPPEVADDFATVRQFRNRVYMKFKNEELDFIASGVIDGGRYVTGSWSDRLQGGYHGAFQLIVDPKTRNMSGTWVGFSTSGMVKCGSWIWHRTAEEDAISTRLLNLE